MADAETKVVVRAETAGAIAQLKPVEHAIEGMISPVNVLRESLTGIAEITGLAYVAEKLREIATVPLPI